MLVNQSHIKALQCVRQALKAHDRLLVGVKQSSRSYKSSAVCETIFESS